LRRLARRASELYDSHLAPAGLTGAQFSLLAHIYGSEVAQRELTLSRLAERSGLDATTLNRTLKPLERAGWVASVQSTEDRRRRLLRTTAEGAAKLAEAAGLWREAGQALKRTLGRDAFTALEESLAAALQRL
jgi:DNA-binding MarR family transcriptional regulator